MKNIVHLISERSRVMVFKVELSKQAEVDLKRLPNHIVFKLQMWIDGVENEGLGEMQKRLGFHDEPLKGKRDGQRSIPLNKAYRAIYKIDESGIVHFINILEVNKHVY